MTEPGTPQRLEQEIARIEQELSVKREALERQKESGEISNMPHERETLHEVIGQKLQGAPASLPPAYPPTAILPGLQQKAQALVNSAFLKSINEAIKEVRATNNAALIDAFHDLLVDELYDQLIARGKLKRL